MKLLINACFLDKCINYFCPWLFEIWIYVLRLDFWLWWVLGWCPCFMGKMVCLGTKICKFSSWFVVFNMYNEMYKVYVITYNFFYCAHVPDMLWSWGKVVCVVITAVAMNVTFSQVFSKVEKRWRQRKLIWWMVNLNGGNALCLTLCLTTIRERMWEIREPHDCWARELFCSWLCSLYPYTYNCCNHISIDNQICLNLRYCVSPCE